MSFDCCARCGRLVVPNASEWLQATETVCLCSAIRRPSLPTPSENTIGRRPTELLVLPYPPILNHLYATVNGHRVLSKSGRDYHKVVAKACLGFEIFQSNVSVTIYAYRPQRRGDLDGVFKVCLDSLTGNLWRDDCQVVEIHAFRRDDKQNPRVEITIKEI